MAPIISKPRRPVFVSNKAQRAGLSRRQYERLEPNSQLAAHLDQWRRITKDEEVLHIVTRGLRFELTGSPSLRRRSVQFQCTPAQRVHLRDCLSKWLQAEYIEPAMPDSLLISLLFPVPKANGDLRWVMDMSTLNRFIVPRKFKMTSVPAVRQLLQPGDWMSSLDLSAAFQQLSIDPRYQHLLGFRADDQVFRWRVGVFGIASMPRLFSRVIKPVIAKLHRLGIRCLAYLDDFLFAASTRALAIIHTSVALKLLRSLGLQINEAKSETTPKQAIVFLGFKFDTTRWRVSVPADKIEALRRQAKQVLRAHSAGTLSIRRLASLHGKLIAMMPAMQAAAYRRHSISRCIQHGLRRQHRPPATQNWDALVSLSCSALRDTKWAASQRVRTSNGAPIRMSPTKIATFTTDASGAGWGGILDLPRTSTTPALRFETSGLWHGRERELSINWQETKAIALTFFALATHLPSSTRELRFLSDNTTAVSALRRWGARFRHIGEAIDPLLEDLLRRRLFVSTFHLAGVLNDDADGLSRRHADLIHEWRLSDAALAMLSARSGAPTIDWFAAPGATHAPSFATRYPDARATATDAFRQTWAAQPTDVQLLVPPIPLLERTANKIWTDRPANGWLVMPDWPTRPYYATMAALVPSESWIVLPTDALVPYSAEYHPMRDKVAPQLVAVPLHTYRESA